MVLQPQALFIEAGHGKSPLGITDVGATTSLVENGKNIIVTERSLTLRLANYVYNILISRRAELGQGLIQSVGVDTAASVGQKMAFVNRVIQANRFDSGKCFGIAIHINSAADPTAGGIEAWYQPGSEEGILLCDFIAKGLDEWSQMGLRSKYLKPSNESRFGRLYIQDANCTYMLIECGFITNNRDLSILRNQIDRVATGIAHGLLQYFRKRLRKRNG